MVGIKRRSKKSNRKDRGLLKKILKRAVELYGNQISTNDLHKLGKSEFPQEYSKEGLDEEIQGYVALGYLAKVGTDVIVTHKFADLISREKTEQLTPVSYTHLTLPTTERV